MQDDLNCDFSDIVGELGVHEWIFKNYVKDKISILKIAE